MISLHNKFPRIRRPPQKMIAPTQQTPKNPGTQKLSHQNNKHPRVREQKSHLTYTTNTQESGDKTCHLTYATTTQESGDKTCHLTYTTNTLESGSNESDLTYITNTPHSRTIRTGQQTSRLHNKHSKFKNNSNGTKKCHLTYVTNTPNLRTVRRRRKSVISST